jgi:hypothetical protein
VWRLRYGERYLVNATSNTQFVGRQEGRTQLSRASLALTSMWVGGSSQRFRVPYTSFPWANRNGAPDRREAAYFLINFRFVFQEIPQLTVIITFGEDF